MQEKSMVPILVKPVIYEHELPLFHEICPDNNYYFCTKFLIFIHHDIPVVIPCVYGNRLEHEDLEAIPVPPARLLMVRACSAEQRCLLGLF